jgi:peptide chain release factor subunit 1
MITKSQASRLRSLCASSPSVLSVYLRVPLDLADHRGLATRARELLKSAAVAAPDTAHLRASDIERVGRAIAERAHDWLGHTAAMFACAELDLFEAEPLPGDLPECAVIGTRPYLRPLLSALQRNPAYRAAIIDTRHAWIFAIADDSIDTVAERTGPGVPSQGFSGWYGLEGYRIQQRIMHLARQHFRDTITMLERTADSDRRPLVIGGHESEVNQFLSRLPRGVKQSLAGTFSVDTHTVTPARVRELATPVIARWAENYEAQLVTDVLSEQQDMAARDLAGCLAAVKSRAVSHLIAPDDLTVPGFACDACGAMTAGPDGCDCPDPAAACRAVPDLIDELTNRVLDDGGRVTYVRDAPFQAAAKLRFPVAVGTVR